MTSLQKAKLLKIAPNSLGMFMFMQKFEAEYKQKVQNLEEMFDQKLRELAEKMAIQREEHMKGMEEIFDQKLTMMGKEAIDTFNAVKNRKPIAGADYPIPKDGKTPTREELIALIQPLVPKIKDGRTPTEAELTDIMRPLIPNVNEYTIAQKVLAELKLPDAPTAEAIADIVLEKLKEEKVGIDNIEGLRTALNVLNRNIAELKGRKLQGSGGGGGMGNWVNDHWQGNNSTTQFTLTSRVASGGTAIMVLLNGQVQEYSTHFSVSNKTLTFTTAPFSGAEIHAWYVRA